MTNVNRAGNFAGDRGAVTTMFAVLGVGLLAAASVAVDGGRKLGAISEARDIADNAARAGAQMVDEDAWKTTGIPTIDGTAAIDAAETYLADQGHLGEVSVNATTVTVTVSIYSPGWFLPGSTVIATESASAVSGF